MSSNTPRFDSFTALKCDSLTVARGANIAGGLALGSSLAFNGDVTIGTDGGAQTLTVRGSGIAVGSADHPAGAAVYGLAALAGGAALGVAGTPAGYAPSTLGLYFEIPSITLPLLGTTTSTDSITLAFARVGRLCTVFVSGTSALYIRSSGPSALSIGLGTDPRLAVVRPQHYGFIPYCIASGPSSVRSIAGAVMRASSDTAIFVDFWADVNLSFFDAGTKVLVPPQCFTYLI